MRHILIAGAGSGLGNSLIDGITQDQDYFFLVSKSKHTAEIVAGNHHRVWIEADLSDPENISRITAAVGQTPLDILIYNSGIWETKEFEKLSGPEIEEILHVNLTGAILLVQKLLKNIRKGELKKIIFIGSTCGLENEGGDAVVYAATKFGLRGLTHALREYVRRDGIAVSCISPGSLASDIHFKEGVDAALKKYKGERIPVADIVAVINVIIHSTFAACIKEIHIPAVMDEDV